MFKPDLNQLEDFLELIAYACPEEVYRGLANFQPGCRYVDSCYDCCIGKQKSHKNSVWKYKEDILNDY